MKSLLDKFLSLRCAGDVLESLQPLDGDITRRIKESMTLIEAIRPLVLKHYKGEYKLMEFCSGVPLTAVIAAHLLPIEHATAYVRRPKGLIKNLERVQHLKCMDIVLAQNSIPGKTIVVAPSANTKYAETIVDICRESDAPMALIPSRGKFHLSRARNMVARDRRTDRYTLWLDQLASECDGDWRYPDSLYSVNDGLVTRGL